MNNYLHRIQEFIDYKRLSNREFEISVDLSGGVIKKNIKAGSALGADSIENILEKYPEINPDWLMCGNPPMLRTDIGVSGKDPEKEKLKTRVDILEEMLVKANEKLAKALMDKQDLETQLKNKKSA